MTPYIRLLMLNIFVTLPESKLQNWIWIFAWKLNYANKTSLETFWHTQVWNLKYLSWTIALFFLNFLLLFLVTLSY